MGLDRYVVGQALAKRRKYLRFDYRLLMVGGVILVLALIVGVLVHGRTNNNPVPVQVRKAVDFPVYYPKQSMLPSGYSLDVHSFRLAQPGVVIFSIDTGNQKLIFSEETAPEGNVIDKFTSSYIPLHNTITTDAGKAMVGSAGQGTKLQMIVSLPITKGPWLIITAPAGTKQSDMQRILQSLTR